jgi:hypothetical protein
MTVVLAFSTGDADQALALLEFIGQLGGCQEYSALIVVDAAVDWAKCVDALTLANRAFRDARIIATETPVTGWPAGANALWLKAAHHCKCAGTDWLWLEPDAIPVKRGWLVAIDKMRKGHRYFGHIYPYREQVMKVMSGIAVYPPDAFDLIGHHRIEPNEGVGRVQRGLWYRWPLIPILSITRRRTWPDLVENRNSETPRNASPWINSSRRRHLPSKQGSYVDRVIAKEVQYPTSDNFVVVLPFCMLDVLQ